MAWIKEKTIQIDDMDSCELFSFIGNGKSTKNYCAWLVIGASPIVMFHYMEMENRHVICSVEVRSSSRGYGLGHWFMKWAEENLMSTQLYSTGQYTPEGARSLQGKFPLDPIYSRANRGYGSQNYVRDWDEFELR